VCGNPAEIDQVVDLPDVDSVLGRPTISTRDFVARNTESFVPRLSRE
jgi:hypothetical protein